MKKSDIEAKSGARKVVHNSLHFEFTKHKEMDENRKFLIEIVKILVSTKNIDYVSFYYQRQ